MLETQRDSNALAACLDAVITGDPSIDRQAGLIRISEFLNRVCSALTPK